MMLSAEAEAIVNSCGWIARARTDFLWFVRDTCHAPPCAAQVNEAQLNY